MIILAYILKETVAEFAHSSVENIEKKYIEGSPHLYINRISLDDTLDIKENLTEGIITFDIIFDAIVPKNGEQIKIIMLNLGKKGTSHRLLNLLNLLFLDKKKKEEKEEILQYEYEIELTRDMRKELVEMAA